MRPKGIPMFAIHPHRPTLRNRHDAWEVADRTAAVLAFAAVLLAAAWLGMTI